MDKYNKICQLCGENAVDIDSGTCSICKHIQSSVDETSIHNDRIDKAELIVDLAEHIWEELADNSKSIYVTYTLEDNELTIHLEAPEDEISRIMGKRKTHFRHTKSLLFAVAQKYGFYLQFTYDNL